ncbi:MAG: PAS domain-containing protein [Rhodobacter sp.]|nr:PAS domain-containing protein [Rhodobacter sp.]
MNDIQTDSADTMDQLIAELLPDGHEHLRRLFEDQGSAAPHILWSPKPDDLTNPLIARFAGACDGLPQTNGRILASDFHIEDFAALRDWMLVLDVEGDGSTFRYAHYGNGIADIRGLSMLGQTTESFGGHISRFFTAVYRAVQARKCPVLTVHVPPRQIFARHWERLIVPLFDTAGTVIRFIVLNVPDNELRPGLEIIPDPVLIADENQIVRYANRAAREMFGRQVYLGSNMDLFAFAGIDIILPATPRDLARSRTIRDSISIVLRGALIERFQLTVSGTVQWGNAFYVITLRPAVEQANAAPGHDPAGPQPMTDAPADAARG